jgi:predicted nucleic acid-binding protein
MKQRVYIETTVVSYLTAKPSRDLIVAARQAATEQWWREDRPRCDLFISGLVILEASQGDEDANRRRLEVLSGIPRLAATAEASRLAKLLVRGHAVPPKAEDDAAHIALAAVHRMDVLLTWNLRHIGNVIAAPRIRAIIEQAGFSPPTITTPEDLLGAGGEVR